jgi:hypothetical protein
LLHNAALGGLTFVSVAAMNKVNGAQYDTEYSGGNVNNLAEQYRANPDSAGHNAAQILSRDDMFRMRMESQCQQIKRYRLQVFRDSGRLLSVDDAALEWIARYAASFDHNTLD